MSYSVVKYYPTSVLIVNRFQEFIDSLKLESSVLDISDDGTNTTLVVQYVYHLRAIPNPNRRLVDVDGSNYEVLSVDYDTNTIIVSGVIASATKITVPNPFYFHGTIISTANEIECISPSEKCPMIYLNEIIKERLHRKPAATITTAKIRLAFADFYSNDWTRFDHYQEAIRPLLNLAAFVFEKLDRNSCFRLESDVDQQIVPKWGEITRTGTSKKIFNEYLDAIEWSFDLGICNC